MYTLYRTAQYSAAFVFICIIAALTLQVEKASAAEAAIKQLSADATLNQDGTISVHQTIEYLGTAALDWEVFSNIKSLRVQVDGELLENKRFKVQKKGETRIISSDKFGRKWELEYKTTTTLIRHNDRDQIYFPLFQQTGTSIYATTVHFFLPETVKENS
jgi:hypothetical protein